MCFLLFSGVWKNIQETKSAAFDRFESGSTVITDIMDGSSYRALMVDGGFLDKTSPNLTAVFNTDGVNLFSSSKIDLWPIFLAINELSPPKRFARENIILAGLWQGKGKPPFSEFFKVFADQMNSLYTDGVQILIDSESLNVRLSALCCIADLPAKAELLNMSYFNGPHACIKCEESGITVKQGKGSAKCYPYKVLGNRSSACTDESVRHHMALGIPNKRSYGFKGVSALSDLQNYNIVEGAVPEYMHGVLLGVTKTLMTKWFSASESKKDYFIGQHLKEVSNMMRNLKPPEGIERLPRDLEKHYNHFKATELQSWLLYYGFPCVREFLGDEYLENFSHLSEAVHILLRDYITREELAVATDLLDQFYASFQRLYGDGSCGLNVHNIGCHLPEYVRLWGPLWAWSAFPFEDANATLLQAVHGTGTVLKQLIKYRQAQSYIRRKGLDLRNTVSRKITLKTCNCDIAGAAKPVKPNEIEDEVMEQMEIVPDDLCKLKKVDRVIVNENIFYSKQYTRMKRRICSVVLYGNKEIGSIQYFILCENLVYAVIKKMDQLPASQIPGARVANHYTAVRSTDVLSVVDVVELKKVLVYLNTTGNENAVDTAGSLPYVVSMPNKYGHAVFK